MKTDFTSDHLAPRFLFVFVILLLCLSARFSHAQSSPGSALSFDGVDDYVRVPHHDGLNPFPFSTTIWLKTDQTNGVQVLLSKSTLSTDGYQLYLQNGEARARYFRSGYSFIPISGSGSNGVFVADGQWHQLAYVVDTNGGSLFVDGNLRTRTPWLGTPGPVTNATDLLIGRDFRLGVVNRSWRGLMDEVALWNVALSEQQLRSRLYQPLAGSEPGLAAYWRMDDGTGDIMRDATVNQCHGSLTNGPAWVTSSIPATVGAAPEVVTLAPTAIDPVRATLNAMIDPNGLPTSAVFHWGPTTNYSFVEPVDPGVGNYPVPVFVALTGLTPGALYHYRVAATNSAGYALGEDRTFLPSLPPEVLTREPTDVSAFFENTRATVRGSVLPNWSPTLAWFEWGTSVVYDRVTAPISVGNGSNIIPVAVTLTGLPAHHSYQYRLVASNTAGVVFGQNQTFSAPGIKLLGPAIMTNQCHAPFSDPGARSLQPIVAVSAGTYHCLALTYDGRVVAWGAGATAGAFPHSGQSRVPSGLDNVIAIAAGSLHSIALKRDGTVSAWGSDSYGQGVAPRCLSNIVAIAGGVTFSLALDRDGNLHGWGGSPVGGVDIAPPWWGLAAIAAGSSEGVGLFQNGTVDAWGLVSVYPPAGLSNVAAIAAGHGHALALKRDGTVTGWGGLWTVPDGLSNVTAIAAGPSASQSLALLRDGTVFDWGGYLSTTPPAGLTNVVGIGSGGRTRLALTGDGHVVGWGENDYGQLDIPTNLASYAREVAVSGEVNPSIPGIYTLTYRATNAFGNVGSGTRMVVVADTQPPTLVCPSNITVEFVDETGAPVSFAATAFDNCDGALSVVCVPASGSIFPIGSSQVLCSATDTAGNRAECVFTVTVLGARGTKQNVLSALLDLQSAAGTHDVARLGEAAEHLRRSLEPSLWLDQTHVSPLTGDRVFHEEREALKVLSALLTDSRSQLPPATLRELIDRIVKADRLLATVAMHEAVASGVDARHLGQVTDALDRADQAFAAENFEAAGQHLMLAWRHASRLVARLLCHQAAGRLHLEFATLPGEAFSVETSTNLTDWVMVGPGRADANGRGHFEVSPGTEPGARYYRVKLTR